MSHSLGRKWREMDAAQRSPLSNSYAATNACFQVKVRGMQPFNQNGPSL